MKKLLETIGLGDGDGNTSSSRVFMAIILVATLVPKVVLSIKNGTPVTFDEGDRWVIGMVLGGGVAKTFVENKTPQIVVTSTATQP